MNNRINKTETHLSNNGEKQLLIDKLAKLVKNKLVKNL